VLSILWVVLLVSASLAVCIKIIKHLDRTATATEAIAVCAIEVSQELLEVIAEAEDEEMEEQPKKFVVAFVDGKAYWVEDNEFLEAEIDEDGDPVRSTAHPVDAINMPFKDVTKLLYVLDNLKDKEKQ